MPYTMTVEYNRDMGHKMGRFLFGVLLLACGFLSACATNISTKVHHINDLASVDNNTGSYKGIEAMARLAPDANNPDLKRVNIIYIHGIGWTENADNPELGDSFLSGIASAYKNVDQKNIITNRCRLGHHDTSVGDIDHTFIETAQDVFYETGLRGSLLKIKKLACMDKQVLRPSSNLEFVIYRIFWDDSFWNSLQAAYVGYDDYHGSNNFLASLRKKYNRELKDDIVNYGFSDAVMYLGPAGDLIREAIHGAVCSAALDASGRSFLQQGHIVTKENACKAGRDTSSLESFVFVTESLGSKVLFDVLRETMNDGKYEVIDDISDGSEIFMLANQIPLLSLNNLRKQGVSATPRHVPAQTQTRPRIIAFTELNDFLSYELVPFYETLYSRGYTAANRPKRRDKAAILNPDIRANMIEDIGFDIVDMRVEFADPLLPIMSSFVDPKQAHSDHAKQPLLMRYMLCGAQGGTLQNTGCHAAQNPRK